MKAIWTEEKPEYHGEFVNFDPILCYPKPLQKPHPPILLGAHGPKGLDRAVNYCDGWIPFMPLTKDLSADFRDLRARVAQAGREPYEVPTTVYGAPGEEAALVEYQELGVERAVLMVPPEGRDKILPLLDHYAAFIPKFA